MTLISLEEHTKRFYEEEKEFLLRHYPGLSYERLRSEIESLSIIAQLNPKAVFEGIYLAHSTNPFLQFFKRLKHGEPLEYIRKKAYFYRSEFFVSEDVLIPRSETEILVEQVSDYINRLNKSVSICDIGTGSGAIIISILQEAKLPMTAVAVDISNRALNVARINDFRLHYRRHRNSKLELVESDRLECVDGKFDVIVTNPPYIKEKFDREKVHQQVEAFEPHIALYLKDTEYNNWFEELFQQAYTQLNENGLFYMEGHEDHLEGQVPQMENIGFRNVEVIKDYTGRNRFIKGFK